MSDFGIAGYGIVGKSTHLGLLNNCDIKIHDIIFNTELTDLTNCKYVFFCIPTDSTASVDTLINEIIELKKINSRCTIIIRCTVPIGTCYRIQNLINDKILYIPEFLRDRIWEEDCKKRPLIIGNDDIELPNWLLKEEIITCSLIEAELIKMINNNMAATRIVLANHFYDLSKEFNANYDKIINSYLKIMHEQTYLEVKEDLRAFGGKCLTKDLDFLISTFDNLNITQTYFTAIQEDNKKWPVTVRKS